MEFAIKFAAPGEPEVMQLETIARVEPGPGEIRVRHRAIPVNYIDLQQRSGRYAVDLPSGLGCEAAGIVEAVGEGVEGFEPGASVAYMRRDPGTYATFGICQAKQATRLPPGVTLDEAGAIFLRAIFAWHLTHSVYPVAAGDRVLVLAAGGVLGGLVAQWAKAAGAYVVGAVASPAKADLARAAGCTEVVEQGAPDLIAQVRALTGGGASAVFDSIGAATFHTSLDCLRPHGMLVAYGNASGVIAPFAPWHELGHRGSLRLAWPMLKDFMAPAHMQHAIPSVLAALAAGELRAEIGQRFALGEAAAAHRLVESREARGATILTA